MKNIFKITFLVFIVFCLLYIISPVQAQTLGNEYLTNFGETAGYGGAPLPQVIGRIVKIVLSLLGLIAVIIMIVGGFIWMTSGGVVEKVTKAKKIISSGLIGLLIIVFAYAIVAFVMSRLSGVTGDGSNGGGGCTPTLCCGPGLRCDSGGSCNLSDSSCGFPSDIFRIKKIETTHEGYQENYNQDVYLCSAVQPIFNHSVDSQRIEELELAEELRIETGTNSVSGDWKTRDGAIIFKHDANFIRNTSYKAYLPRSILDTQSKILQQCLAAGGCVNVGSYFIWNFMTGTTIDEISPEITSTYPIFDLTDSDYPDQNVSQKPNIDVSFSEPIDITTVSDENNYPIEANIWIAEIEEQSGEIVETLTKDIFEVGAKSNGFRIRLRDENLLEPFTWYRIHIEDIEDLCSNAMDGAVEWEFQTNDQAPGISSEYPTGNKVCPDTDISIIFNTEMYDNLVRFEITGDDDFIFDIRPSELDTPYEKEVVGGIFKVADFGNPVNNHFRVFTFDPDDDLQSGSDYQVKVLTDLVIDIEGTLLFHTWEFATAAPENCFCSPWISHLKPAQGSKGECLTLYGQCFKGTATQPAEPTKLEFILDETSTESSINGFDNNYLTTQVPNLYSKGNRPEIQMTIEYDTEEQLISNLVEFYVNSNDQADGPCLFLTNPSDGYSGETKVNLSGIRFGTESAESQVVFYYNKSAVYETWGDELVEDALVPLGTEDGLVYLKNDKGMSNSLPFDVLQHQGGPGHICQEMINCSSNPPYTCLSPVYDCMYEATDTCRCCCNVSTNSCENSLDCMANQGDCTGIDRGLCCGCQDDTQCSGSLGCGMLDPNKCCYSRPAVSIKSPTGTDVCLNTAIVVKFNQEMDINSLNKNNIKLTKVSTEENIDFNLIKDSADNSFILYPDGCLLDFKTQYKVDLIGGVDGSGIRSEMGVSMDHSDWNFTTGIETNFCAVDYIKVSPNTSTVESLNNSVEYTSYGYDDNDTSADIKDDISVCISEFNWYSEDVKIAIVNPGKGLQTSVSPVGGEGEQSTDISAAILGKSGIGEFISILSPPVINSLSPDSGTNNLNFPTYITISGNNFGDEQEDSYIEFDSYQAEIGCQNWSNNEIVAIVPSDLELGESYSVTVTNPDQGQSNEKSFEVKDEFHPAICQLSPNQGEEGTLITIEGMSFNAQQGDSYVVFGKGGTNPQTIDEIEASNWFNTEIIITAPEVPEAIASVVVYVPSPIAEENGILKPSNAVSFYQPQNLVQVIEDGTCLDNTPSPSPRHLSSQVCRNSLISARFNIKVKNLLSNNIIVEKCNSGDEIFDNMACSLVNGDISLFSFDEQGFIYTPDDLLIQNNWYQVTLKSGAIGIIDLVNDYQLDGNKNGIEDGSPNDDYIWYFKTKDESEICSAQTIEIIQSKPIGVIVKPGTKDYFALPIGQDCQILRPDTFTWDWKSTKPIVATINEQPLDYIAIATAVDLGETEIEATAIPSVGESITNSVDLVVTTEPNVESFHPSGINACRNSVIKATFNQLMDRNSLSKKNIKLYKKKYIEETESTNWENIDSINISTFDKDFPITNIISDPKKDEVYLYPDDVTALQYCLEQNYSGFIIDYLPTNVSGEYERYNNNEWSKVNFTSYIGTLTCYHENKKTIVNINAGLLGFEQEYKVKILGDENGVESVYGVEMLTDYSSNFTTSNEICTLSKVTIDPEIINFTVAGEVENLNAYTYDNKNQLIVGIPDVYDWTWLWESSDPSVVKTSGSVLKSEDEEITAQNRNGKVQITAKATPTYGDPISGYSNVDVFICENPWIYQDSETNFELRYCREKIISDPPAPLPELLPATIPGEEGSSLIKEFLFSVGESGDVIGLKIFNNKRRLNVLNWYEDPSEGVPNPGNPRTFVIDNYYALQEGRTVYVGATNVVFSNPIELSSPEKDGRYLYPNDTTALQYCLEQSYSGFTDYTTTNEEENYKIYTDGIWEVEELESYISSLTCANTEISPYIYLMSYSDDSAYGSAYGSASETVKIFNQLLDSWEFNTNINNYEDKVKIQNDLLRFYDIQEIKNKLENYYQSSGKYPTLGAGTYISGKTNSLWSSWQNMLAQDLKSSLPNDPINKFNGSCAGCVDEPDLQCNHTCYNPINRTFKFPDGSHFYQYYAPDDPGCWGEYYTLSVNLEYGNGRIIWKGKENEDIITSQADAEGDSNYIYKSLETPVCGDGIVQCGEQCECGNNSQDCEGSFEPETTCEDLGYKSGNPLQPLQCNDCFFDIVSCVEKFNGDECNPGDICESGECVDGVCCDRACEGTCEYCGDEPGWNAGTCHLISAGEDPNNECSNTNGCLTGNCDGHGTCLDAYKDDLKHKCEICEVCDDSGDCAGVTDTGPVPLDTACTNCKRCSGGSCINQTVNQDLWDDCASDTQYQNGGDTYYCQSRSKDGYCNGSGSCKNYGSWTNNVNPDQICSNEDHCVGNTYYDGYTCNAGNCNVHYHDIGCCQDSKCAVGKYCKESNHTCTSVTCTSWTYSGWGTCLASGKRIRIIENRVPPNCSVSSPEPLSQPCTPTCTSWTYSGWGTCIDELQTRTIENRVPPNCSVSSPEPLSQPCTPTCSSWKYSGWGACSANGKQTRIILEYLPLGCTGGTPDIKQDCRPTCTYWTYSGWGDCIDELQTRDILTSSPLGCTGGSPVTSQSCTPTCTSWDYSGWGDCIDELQTRDILTSSPLGCTGGTPDTEQPCTPESPCVPQCLSTGSSCGDDSCGGSCGLCSANQSCVQMENSSFRCCPSLQVCADNEHITYFNGVYVSSAKDWHTVQAIDIIPQPGKNVIAIKAVDYGVVYGFSAVLNQAPPYNNMTTDDVTGWKCTGTLYDNWNAVNYNDSDWPTAIISGSKGIRGGNYLLYKQIWASDADDSGTTVYCRYTFHNPCPDENCAGVCVEIDKDVENCGRCGNVCNFDNADSSCISGLCVMGDCSDDYGDCINGNIDGCETYLINNSDHCGDCEISCEYGAYGGGFCNNDECVTF